MPAHLVRWVRSCRRCRACGRGRRFVVAGRGPTKDRACGRGFFQQEPSLGARPSPQARVHDVRRAHARARRPQHSHRAAVGGAHRQDGSGWSGSSARRKGGMPGPGTVLLPSLIPAMACGHGGPATAGSERGSGGGGADRRQYRGAGPERGVSAPRGPDISAARYLGSGGPISRRNRASHPSGGCFNGPTAMTRMAQTDAEAPCDS